MVNKKKLKYSKSRFKNKKSMGFLQSNGISVYII